MSPENPFREPDTSLKVLSWWACAGHARVSRAWLSPTTASSCCRWGPRLREVGKWPWSGRTGLEPRQAWFRSQWPTV